MIKWFVLLAYTSVLAQVPDTMWAKNYGFKINSVKETYNYNIVITGNAHTVLLTAEGDSIWGISVGGRWIDETIDMGFVIAGDSLMKTDSAGLVEWKKGYSGAAVIQAKDTGYVVIDGGGNNVYKVDAEGESLWTWNVGTSENNVVSLVETEDDGYLLTGKKGTYIWLVKLNITGDTAWTKSYPDSGHSCGKKGKHLINKPGGGFALTGDACGSMFFYILNNNGEITWQKTNGWDRESPISYGYYVQNTYDGGYLLSFENQDFFLPMDEYHVVLKMDSLGNIEWKMKEDYQNRIGVALPCEQDSGYLCVVGDGTQLVKLNKDAETGILDPLKALKQMQEYGATAGCMIFNLRGSYIGKNLGRHVSDGVYLIYNGSKAITRVVKGVR